MRSSTFLRLVLLAISPLAAVGCASETVLDEGEDDLTSVTARSRSLEFEGYVYVPETATDATILQKVRKQTQSAFGALKSAGVAANSRELRDVDVQTFQKTKVSFVDPNNPSAPPTTAVRVKYFYTDNALVPLSMAKQSSLALALLSPDYGTQMERVLRECTDNDAHAREFSSSLWYVFSPTLTSCRAAMAKESAAVDVDAKKVGFGQSPKSESTRLYLPMTVKLGADKTNQGLSYPEYDRLFSGQLQKDTLTVGLVEGFRDHGAEDESDSGFTQLMDQLKETFAGRKWSVVSTSPAVDIMSYNIEGKSVSFASFNELYDGFYGSGGGLTSLQRASLKKEIGKKLIRNWMTFESLANVKIGSGSTRQVRLRMQAYLGSPDVSIHKKMIRTSDVFVYDGHSQIGYGPLDPANFKPSDFTSTYQLFFIDGCVSYNYYEKDYIPLKQGGTRNLDLITNGLEVPSYKSGYAIGKLVNLLLKGKASYADLLRATASTDRLRVVDGELDNVYSPAKTPIVVE